MLYTSNTFSSKTFLGSLRNAFVYVDPPAYRSGAPTKRDPTVDPHTLLDCLTVDSNLSCFVRYLPVFTT